MYLYKITLYHYQRHETMYGVILAPDWFTAERRSKEAAVGYAKHGYKYDSCTNILPSALDKIEENKVYFL